MRRLFPLLVITLCAFALSAQERPDTYIQATVDNATPFVGQPIRYSINVFDRTDTPGLEIGYPAFDGFGQESPVEPVIGTQILEQSRYTTYTQEILLYPNQAGVFVIEPSSLRIPETPFRAEQIVQSTQTVVTVRPLPPNAPQEYRNAVGDFTLAMTVAPLQTVVGGAVNVSVSISGTGNLARLAAPEPLLDESWRMIRSDPVLDGSTTSGTRTFTYTLLPQQAGEQVIPLLVYPVFDPQTQTFKILQADAVTITVVGNGETNSQLATGEPVAPLLMQPTGITSASIVPHLTPALVAWIIPLALAALTWLIQPLRLPSRTNKATARPVTNAHRQLQVAAALPPAQAFPTIGNVLRQSIQGKAARRRLTPQEWVATLEPRVRERIEATVRHADSARYAPATAEDIQQFAREVYSAVRLVESLE